MRRSTAVGVVPRSCSVGMGRIDEERPCEFGDNNYNGVNVRKELLVYPRSRSYAVTKVLEKFGLPDILKSKHEENEAYISEIETIGQAYDDMQAQNQQLLQQITERDNYNVKREEKRARSYSRRPVPKRATTPPSKTRKHSPTPEEEEDIVRERDNTPSPKRGRPETKQDRSDYSENPRENSRSPVRESPAAERYQSPSEANCRSPTASPRNDTSPVDDDDNHQSPRGSESP
ncbi:hypothetical protein TEA_005733 [Camellia sinensis var. sinensis]|uniref:E3 ubiquitin protein ligase n=1 Tax=Camellia sinensis var. sinensis TaxID=542762 RepID=A0A4S4DPL4_CAMSN|nr:hypothetical protein TEA_005733 [Camellia sinensis var. sinensis]